MHQQVPQLCRRAAVLRKEIVAICIHGDCNYYYWLKRESPKIKTSLTLVWLSFFGNASVMRGWTYVKASAVFIQKGISLTFTILLPIDISIGSALLSRPPSFLFSVSFFCSISSLCLNHSMIVMRMTCKNMTNMPKRSQNSIHLMYDVSGILVITPIIKVVIVRSKVKFAVMAVLKKLGKRKNEVE